MSRNIYEMSADASNYDSKCRMPVADT